MAAVLETGSHLIKLSVNRREEDERKSEVGGGEIESHHRENRQGRMSAVELRGD